MRIVLIGAGNVATHLGEALKKAKHEILQVFSRSESSAKTLSKSLRSSYCTDLKAINGKADLYIVSISDHAIKGLLKSFPIKDKIIVHTSGPIGIRVFGDKFQRCGVIYPLQTFSKERKINFKEVPLLIEASDSKTMTVINGLAHSISGYIFEIGSDSRKTIHLSAVVTNNFTNHLFVQAEKILHKKNIPFFLLGPLLHETVIKALLLSPKNAQTGPAKRGDTVIIEEHLKMLGKNPDLQTIYKLMSESIEKESGAML